MKKAWKPDIDGAISRLEEAATFAARQATNPYNPKHCQEMYGLLGVGIQEAIDKCLKPPVEQGLYHDVKPEPNRR